MPPHEPCKGGTVAGADPPDELGIVEPRGMAFGVTARSCRAPHQRRPMLSAFAMDRHGKGSERDHLVPVPWALCSFFASSGTHAVPVPSKTIRTSSFPSFSFLAASQPSLR